jgi:hypothetical protein
MNQNRSMLTFLMERVGVCNRENKKADNNSNGGRDESTIVLKPKKLTTKLVKVRFSV